MSWEKTGEVLPDGRPIWECRKCNKRICIVWKCGCDEIKSGVCVLAAVEGDAYGKIPGVCVSCKWREAVAVP